MVGVIEKKTKNESLEEMYRKLTKEAEKLSKSNRFMSDLKYAAAEGILLELQGIEG